MHLIGNAVFVVFFAWCGSVQAQFIGRTVGSGGSQSFQTDNFNDAIQESHLKDLGVSQDVADELPNEVIDPDLYANTFSPDTDPADVGFLAQTDSLPEETDSESIENAVTQKKAELGLPPDAPITASTYAAINEINAVNSNNQNAAQLGRVLVKLSIGNQGNCANYLSITQGQTLNVAELRSAIQLADASNYSVHPASIT